MSVSESRVSAGPTAGEQGVSDAPLAEQLKALADFIRQNNRAFAETVDKAVEQLKELQAGSTVADVGEKLPEFCLSDDMGSMVSLSGLLANGPLVLAFRRGHWCPYCVLSTNALARIQQQAKGQGASIAVISPERAAYSRALREKAGAEMSMLFDMDNGYALSIGLAVAVSEELRKAMSGVGILLERFQGNDAWILPIPATFVLDRSGTIVFRHVDADYRHRASTEDVLAAIAKAVGAAAS